ncbi:hypothetical protein DAEQUDRAFT_566057 [Daedalea quercina L-15889]|uniref:Uncharacterized protein n=1 Tax=Daedalea quercina L-15889 TaxID=1314783 RepID=A0A165LXP6_9APHY|nr:hypothetical protein DAEQUDRAFT_566057 [Daedalea quercina L-15889]
MSLLQTCCLGKPYDSTKPPEILTAYATHASVPQSHILGVRLAVSVTKNLIAPLGCRMQKFVSDFRFTFCLRCVACTSFSMITCCTAQDRAPILQTTVDISGLSSTSCLWLMKALMARSILPSLIRRGLGTGHLIMLKPLSRTVPHRIDMHVVSSYLRCPEVLWLSCLPSILTHRRRDSIVSSTVPRHGTIRVIVSTALFLRVFARCSATLADALLRLASSTCLTDAGASIISLANYASVSSMHLEEFCLFPIVCVNGILAPCVVNSRRTTSVVYSHSIKPTRISQTSWCSCYL